MQRITPERLVIVSWSLFLLLVIASIFVAAAIPFGPITIMAIAVATIFSVRFPYVTLYLGIILTPFLGLIMSLPTGSMLIGRRAFGGAVDMSIGEVVMIFALLGWAVRLIFFWRKRHDEEWRPRMPLFVPAVGLACAHIFSVFSPLIPDPLLVIKFGIRPVFFDYVAFVALPYNFIRSRKRLVAALGAFAVVSSFAALNGLFAMFFPTDPGMTIGRARPLSIFGVAALGENQNELAELLVVGAPLTLALAWLMRDSRFTRIWTYLAALQGLVALLTFTRTAWIVMTCEVLFLAFGSFRKQIQKQLAVVSIVLACLVPLGVVMAVYVVSNTARSSTSTRLMLSEIAWELFKASPVFGAGAGTFYDRVGSTKIFLIEYGAPLDSHGWLQKIGAETGMIGIAALSVFLYVFARICMKGVQKLQTEISKQAASLLIAAAGGGIVYQFFNTDYWTGKMWLPIGFALAGIYVLSRIESEEAGSRSTRAHDILVP